MENEIYQFTTGLDVGLFTLDAALASARWLDWQKYDRGPGIFSIPSNLMLGIRAQYLDDESLRVLADDLAPVTGLRYLYLAENRGITNHGAQYLSQLTQLRYLNLSACDINSMGIAFLPSLTNLEYLNLSYCNRISEKAAPYVQKLNHLSFLDLQGCIKVNTGGLKKFEKKGLTIHRF